MSDYVPLTRKEISARYLFPLDRWIDCGTYYINLAEQCSDEWLAERKNRLTASNFGAAVGDSSFVTPLELGLDITGLKPLKPTYQGKFNMQHGVVNEPHARNWYETQKGVKVKEVGLAVPKWEPRIGGSADGVVLDAEGRETDTAIEIKCPQHMYKPLLAHIQKLASGWSPPTYYHDHIWKSHYAQMQGVMAILGKKKCDYIVYATASNQCYTETILFNEDYWNNDLYPRINDYLDQTLEPLITQGFDSDLFLAVEC